MNTKAISLSELLRNMSELAKEELCNNKKASLARSAEIEGLTTNLPSEKKALPKKPGLRKNATQDCSC